MSEYQMKLDSKEIEPQVVIQECRKHVTDDQYKKLFIEAYERNMGMFVLNIGTTVDEETIQNMKEIIMKAELAKRFDPDAA